MVGFITRYRVWTRGGEEEERAEDGQGGEETAISGVMFKAADHPELRPRSGLRFQEERHLSDVDCRKDWGETLRLPPGYIDIGEEAKAASEQHTFPYNRTVSSVILD